MSNKTVIVTGGAKGIGAKIATTFVLNGYNVVINYRSTIDEDFLNSLKEKGNVSIFKGDVSILEDCKNLIDFTIETYGKVDVLVNNAGITDDMLVMRMKEEQFDRVINTNLKGVFNTTSYISKFFVKQKSGSIINISSVVGVMGNAGQSNYAASKAGVIGFTKSIARELGKKGICANCIAPGFIETAMTDKLNDKVKEAMLKNIPLNRFGTDEEVANTALFLAESTYITGQTINVCGGMVM